MDTPVGLWPRIHANIWGISAEEDRPLHIRLASAPLEALRIVLLSVEGFRRNRLASHASSLAFFALLSVVPAMAFLFILLKAFQLRGLVRPFLLEFVAGGNELLAARFAEYIEKAQGAALGGLGLATLFLIGFLILQRVISILNIIWGVKTRPGFGHRFIEYLTVLVVTPLLLMASLSLSAYLRSPGVVGIVSEWEPFGAYYAMVGDIFAFPVFWLTAYYAYAFLPDVRVRFGPALAGALVGGTALKFAQSLYITLNIRTTDFNLIYGALAFLPFLMIWFYLAGGLFLFGAQLSYVVQNYRALLERRRLGVEGGSTAPYLALGVLIGLWERMERAEKPPPVKRLARSLGLPMGVTQEALNRLSEAGLITPVQGEPGCYVPRERLDGLPVREVLQRMNAIPGFAVGGTPSFREGGEALRRVFSDANRAMMDVLDTVTLAELRRGVYEPSRAENAPKGAA